ncbi:oxidoreductase [Wolbachia pipientis]|uniref:Oxidoreductase n=1 Tax=Wolbachia pipientis TaxID=955 RepID=A0A1E7QJQ1_WOLPI|nr:NADH dehydrogenase ubiquinone Fe-S protein 4 [Wolbachia pipientis]OEY86693.1 oxidoreductase [Wolbachia pipientis]
MIFKIYRPTKSAMQSGLGNTKFWHIEVESSNSYYIDSQMGWVGSRDPRKQIVLKFDSLQKAVSFAEKCNTKYIIEMPKNGKRLPKSYTSNFLK